MKNKVLILGATGMLGAMVYDYLSQNESILVYGTIRNKSDSDIINNHFYFDANDNISKQLGNIYENYHFNYLVNCIGVIKPFINNNNPKLIKNAINLNSILPFRLNDFISRTNDDIKLLQIATDCVFSGKTGKYTEESPHDAHDVYGKTKSLGEIIDKNILNIRTSIIGPEIKNKQSLLEWFLNQRGKFVYGFDHHRWNGVTTLQYAKLIENIIMKDNFKNLRNINHVLHYVKNETVTKYELLIIFKKLFSIDTEIIKTNEKGPPVYRNLNTLYFPQSIQNMYHCIEELKFYLDHYSKIFQNE